MLTCFLLNNLEALPKCDYQHLDRPKYFCLQRKNLDRLEKEIGLT